MPGNRKITLKNIKGRDGVHPGSRKAGQITRAHLRSAKLQKQAKTRKDLKVAKLFRPTFFHHALSGPQPLSLPSLRALVSDVYLTRNDERINELEAERRPGRPKTKEHMELEEIRKVEHAEWETGFEVIDLTDGPTTRLMWSWLESETNMQHSHVDLLPFIRIAKDTPEVVVVSRPGRVGNMGLGNGVEGEGEDWTTAAKADKDEEMEA